MRTLPALVALVVLSGLPAGAQLALAPGDPAPQIVGWDLDGELVSVPWGGITLVNFWTTWCEPCREEMPALEELQQSLGGQGLRVVGFNREPEATAEQVRDFVTGLKVTYTILRPDHRWSWGGIPTVPTSFLVNREGVILRRYVGANREQVDGLKRDVTDALNGRPLQPMVLPKSDSKTTTF